MLGEPSSPKSCGALARVWSGVPVLMCMRRDKSVHLTYGCACVFRLLLLPAWMASVGCTALSGRSHDMLAAPACAGIGAAVSGGDFAACRRVRPDSSGVGGCWSRRGCLSEPIRRGRGADRVTRAAPGSLPSFEVKVTGLAAFVRQSTVARGCPYHAAWWRMQQKTRHHMQACTCHVMLHLHCSCSGHVMRRLGCRSH